MSTFHAAEPPRNQSQTKLYIDMTQEEREHAIMVEWGYTWDEKAKHWVAEGEDGYTETLGSPDNAA